MIKLDINNGGKLELSQHQDGHIILSNYDNKNNCESKLGINEGDLVMLLNYYRYVKDNNIQCDFINPNGLKL